MKTKPILLVLVALLIVGSGCSTKIRSYAVQSDNTRKGGVPYFIPKAMIQIREPIEVSRSETLFAVIDIGGLDEYLFLLNNRNLKQSINELEKLLGKTAGSIDIKGAHIEPVYLTEHVEKSTIKEEQHKSQTTESTKKFSVLTIADTSKDESVTSTPFYKPAEIEKAFAIVWVPDYSREYELIINPSLFASSEISITLADGWRLEEISSKTGENQLIKELSETLRTVVNTQKEIDIAKIGKDQVIKLKELELAEKDAGEKALGFRDKKELVVKVKGYVKKSEVRVIMPGIYDLSKILSESNSGKIDFPVSTTTLWSRVKL